MENKKEKMLTIIAVITLIALISGATYAYFAVGTTNNFGTSTINATADSIGSVALNGNSAQLNMDLTAVDMMQQTNSITYYASSDNKTTTPTEEVIAVASVSPTTDTNYYHCEYTLSISHTGTNDMYDLFNHQTNNTYDYTNRSTGQIILTVNGVDYDWASTDGMPSTIDGEFYIQGTDEVEITAGLRLINKNNVNQTYLSGSDVSITISLQQNSFTCTAEEEPSIAYWTYLGSAATTANATKSSSYSNLNGVPVYLKVADVYTINGECIYYKNNEYVTQISSGLGPGPGYEFCQNLATQYSIDYDDIQIILSAPSTLYNIVDTLNECQSEGYNGALTDAQACYYIQDSSLIFIKETPDNGNISSELCVNLKNNNVDNVLCVKPNDWTHVDDYKAEFESAGATCSKSNWALTCHKDKINFGANSNGYIYAGGYETNGIYGYTDSFELCNITSSGIASCNPSTNYNYSPY